MWSTGTKSVADLKMHNQKSSSIEELFFADLKLSIILKNQEEEKSNSLVDSYS